MTKANRVKRVVKDEYTVMGRTLAQWTPTNKLRVPSKELDPMDAGLIVSGILKLLHRNSRAAFHIAASQAESVIEALRDHSNGQAELPLQSS